MLRRKQIHVTSWSYDGLFCRRESTLAQKGSDTSLVVILRHLLNAFEGKNSHFPLHIFVLFANHFFQKKETLGVCMNYFVTEVDDISLQSGREQIDKCWFMSCSGHPHAGMCTLDERIAVCDSGIQNADPPRVLALGILALLRCFLVLCLLGKVPVLALYKLN